MTRIKRDILSREFISPRRFTIEQYAREEAPCYAEANNVSLTEAEESIRRDMVIYLSLLRINEKRRGPFGFGLYYKKLSPNEFIEFYVLSEMKEAVRQRMGQRA